MFMRLLYLQAKSDDIDVLRSFYDAIVIPELQKIDGCLFAGLLQSNTDVREGISLTLWDTQKHAEDYEKSGMYKKLLEQAWPLLAESAEWKIHLSEDLELQYKTDNIEPDLGEFKVTVHERMKDDLFKQHSEMYVRIVSHILQKEKIGEFRNIYSEKIIPSLQHTKGCRYAYLVESMHQTNEVISLSIWDSKADAEAYEKSGLFEQLLDELRPTFSQFYQWKMALKKNSTKIVKTSEDLKISNYKVVTGKNLRKSFPENR
jgi:heme-degrading monooxygenase HmoA